MLLASDSWVGLLQYYNALYCYSSVAVAVHEDERVISEVYLPDKDMCWKHYFTEEVTRGGTFITDLAISLETVHFWTKIEC